MEKPHVNNCYKGTDSLLCIRDVLVVDATHKGTATETIGMGAINSDSTAVAIHLSIWIDCNHGIVPRTINILRDKGQLLRYKTIELDSCCPGYPSGAHLRIYINI